MFVWICLSGKFSQIESITKYCHFFFFFFFSFSFFRLLRSELPERNSKQGNTLGSECDLKNACQKSGYTFPYTFFRRLPNLTATLTAYIFGTKHDIHNRASALTITVGLFYIVSKCHELWSTNGFKVDRHFTHPTKILLSTSLPGFADGHQAKELNQALPNGGR